MSAAFYSLAEAFDLMRREGDHSVPTSGEGDNDLLTQMIQSLLSSAETPPREVEGVSEEFCDGAYPLLYLFCCEVAVGLVLMLGWG